MVQKYANLVELENAVKRIFSCKISFWYSRERARQKIVKLIFAKKIANFTNFANIGTAPGRAAAAKSDERRGRAAGGEAPRPKRYDGNAF